MSPHSGESFRTFDLSAHLPGFLPISISLPDTGAAPEQIKKQARLEVSVQQTSESLGFLHACLVRVHDRYYLLAGPSGVGKTTYSKFLEENLGGELLGNDWVAVCRQGEKLFVSDLNFAEAIRHDDNCQLSGVILLTHQDAMQRDAFVPNDDELVSLLQATFDTATPQQQEKLLSFWLANKELTQFVCALPTRRSSIPATAQTLRTLLERDDHYTTKFDAGVIGLGTLGSTLAYELSQSPLIGRVSLHNRTYDKALGLSMDMNQGGVDKGPDAVVPYQSAEEVFAASSIVFLTIRDVTPVPYPVEMPERWRKLPTHLQHMKELAAAASEVNFNGSIFVITNPVDILTYALFFYSQQLANPLKTFQVYGAGLELDVSRALTFARQRRPEIGRDDLHIYGNHADEFVLETPFSPEDTATLHRHVQSASEEIRGYVQRTVYGPVSAIMKNVHALILGQSTHLTVVQEDSHIGRRINFKHMLPGLPAGTVPAKYHQIVENNRDLIRRYIDV